MECIDEHDLWCNAPRCECVAARRDAGSADVRRHRRRIEFGRRALVFVDVYRQGLAGARPKRCGGKSVTKAPERATTALASRNATPQLASPAVSLANVAPPVQARVEHQLAAFHNRYRDLLVSYQPTTSGWTSKNHPPPTRRSNILNAIATGFVILLVMSIGGCCLTALFERWPSYGVNPWFILGGVIFLGIFAWLLGTLFNFSSSAEPAPASRHTGPTFSTA